jgi:hypothetical protein
MGKQLQLAGKSIQDVEEAIRRDTNKDEIQKYLDEDLPSLITLIEELREKMDPLLNQKDAVISEKQLVDITPLEELSSYNKNSANKYIDNTRIIIQSQNIRESDITRLLENTLNRYSNYTELRETTEEQLKEYIEDEPHDLFITADFSKEKEEKMVSYLEKQGTHIAEEILENNDFLTKPSDPINHDQYQEMVDHIRNDSIISNNIDQLEKFLEDLEEGIEDLIGSRLYQEGDLQRFETYLREEYCILK